jgi:hypothetical protein
MVRNLLEQELADKEYLQQKEERRIDLETHLDTLTQGLTLAERVIFKTTYRFSSGLQSSRDYDFIECLDPHRQDQLLTFATRQSVPYMPRDLWREVPWIDPLRSKRAEIDASRVAQVPVFIAKNTPSQKVAA